MESTKIFQFYLVTPKATVQVNNEVMTSSMAQEIFDRLKSLGLQINIRIKEIQ